MYCGKKLLVTFNSQEHNDHISHFGEMLANKIKKWFASSPHIRTVPSSEPVMI